MMFAERTLCFPPRKSRLTLVTCPPHSLRRHFSHKILGAWSFSWNRQDNRRSWHHDLFSIPNAGQSLVLHLLRHRSHDWEPGALFASGVLATPAHLFWAKGLLAAVALSVHAHANLLLYALTIAIANRSPIARFKGEIVLGKQRAYLVFLRGVGSGSGCVWWTAVKLWGRRRCHDGLGRRSRLMDRWTGRRRHDGSFRGAGYDCRGSFWWVR